MIVPTEPSRSPQAMRTGVLHAFFDHAAARWPDQIAVDIPPGSGRPRRHTLSYRELQRQANALARALWPLVRVGERGGRAGGGGFGEGGAGECVVAVLLGRQSEFLYGAQLGVLKAGAAYTCIDPSFPDAQLREILQDSHALVTDAAGRSRLARMAGEMPVGNIIDVASACAAHDGRDPPSPAWLGPHALAYVIYTSGTTGRPKGVMIEHGSISNLVAADLAEFGISPQDRVAQGSSPAYDSSVEETWLALSAGATLVVLDEETVRLGPDLVPWLARERVTVLCPPPTLLRTTCCQDPEAALPELRLLYVGGEALPRDVADRWARGRCLVNGYGPTEATVTSLRGRIEPGGPLTIGVPVPGLRAWVLSEDLQEVAPGESGELCLGGLGLALGYRNLPEQTAEKFPIHPRLGRIYRTGDLVHQAPDGRFFYEGRLDSQVKLRGYRVELEAIEARLAQCPGVREAACRLQDDGLQPLLVGYVVPADPAAVPDTNALQDQLHKVLPGYMVPSRWASLAELPRTVGGKVNRKALPAVGMAPGHAAETSRDNGSAEELIRATFSRVLSVAASAGDDFFHDLGGDSLTAAVVISLLRAQPATASITMRDLYVKRSAAALAELAQTPPPNPMMPRGEAPGTSAFVATALQSAWLLCLVPMAAALVVWSVIQLLPAMIERLGLIPLLLLEPLIVFACAIAYAPLGLALAVLIKKLLIGRYQPLRAPVWGSFYLRNWFVQQAVRLVPWGMFEGTVFYHAGLRALGARIGKRVHLHRGVRLLQGGWDLLEIGDDVTVAQDAHLGLVQLEAGEIVVGTVTLGDRCTMDIRSGIGPNASMEPDTYLTALSYLPSGQRLPRGESWDGIPASRQADSPPPPTEIGHPPPPISTLAHGSAFLVARAVMVSILALPTELLALAVCKLLGVDGHALEAWLAHPSLRLWPMLAVLLAAALAVPFTLLVEALVMRALGRVRQSVISRWSLDYIRVWIKADLVDAAGRWLSGSLFWPVWLRWAGMKIGRNCEISTIIDVIPELCDIGDECFLADGIYLGGPRIHRGMVTLAPLRLASRIFLGNHVVVPAGQKVPSDVLLGVCTVADDTFMQMGSDWFGHPPFALPRREVVACDRSLTHDPGFLRYWNRVFWETLRFALPVIPAALVPLAFSVVPWEGPDLAAALPLVVAATALALCLGVLAMKWILLGRVRTGQHPLWSCWCSRWDFLYVAWGFYASEILAAFEGTLLLAWYLRAMGARIGRRVVLGQGFAHVVDPDMLHLADHATVDCHFQAHTFEDRVLKIDHVLVDRYAHVGDGAVLLCGARVGERTHVAPHSVVMKKESLLPGRAYEGFPTRSVGVSPALPPDPSLPDAPPSHTRWDTPLFLEK